MMKIAFGRPSTIGCTRLIMPDMQSPPMPRLSTRFPWKYSAQKPRSVRLLPSITMFCPVTGTSSSTLRLEK